MSEVAPLVRAYVPMRYTVLGTDGVGCSDARDNLRRHFEVGRFHVAHAAIGARAGWKKNGEGCGDQAVQVGWGYAESVNRLAGRPRKAGPSFQCVPSSRYGALLKWKPGRNGPRLANPNTFGRADHGVPAGSRIA
jgi:hypothetical protein